MEPHQGEPSTDGARNDPRVDLGAYAERIMKARSEIANSMPGRLFSDAALDILLGLFGATEKGVRVSVSDCAHIARLPPTTALRWVNLLINEGLLKRVPDEMDERRSFVRLNASAVSAVTRYLRTLASLPPRPNL